MPGTPALARAPQYLPTNQVSDLIDLAHEYISSAETVFFAIRKLSDKHSSAFELAGVGMDYLNLAEETLRGELERALEVTKCQQ